MSDMQLHGGAELNVLEEELVRAAYRAVSQRGSHRVSLADIAREANVSRGLLSYHFDSKDDLLFKTMAWALAEMGRRIRLHTIGIDEPEQRLTKLLDVLFVSPEQNRRFMLVYLDLVEHARRVPEFARLFTMVRSVINDYYAELIQHGISTDAFDLNDPATAVLAMRAQIEGTFVTWLQEDDLEATHATYRSLCEGGLRRVLGIRSR